MRRVTKRMGSVDRDVLQDTQDQDVRYVSLSIHHGIEKSVQKLNTAKTNEIFSKVSSSKIMRMIVKN